MQPTQNLAHVYVIKNELGLVKIGFATNPQKRFASIESASGLKIVDSYVSPICFNYAEIEKALHAQFKPFRKAGEWFNTDFNTIVTAANNHFNTQSDSKELAPFNFNGHELRVITDDKGESWFIAKDVCEALELDDTSKAVSRLDDDEKGTRKVRTLGGMQEMNCINESGLYALILRSNKPQAKPFRKWVTSEVLPAIRKTGSYGQATRQIDEAFTPDQRAMLYAAVRQVVQEAMNKHHSPVQRKQIQQHSGKRFDTGLYGENSSRFQMIKNDIKGGVCNPSTRQIKKRYKARYDYARDVLAELARCGVLVRNDNKYRFGNYSLRSEV